MASLNTNSYLQSTEWKNARPQGYRSKQVDVVPTFWGPVELSHRCAQSRVPFPSIAILRVNSQVQLWKESIGHLSILFYSCSLCDKRYGHWSSHIIPQPSQKSGTALPKPNWCLCSHTTPVHPKIRQTGSGSLKGMATLQANGHLGRPTHQSAERGAST